MLIYYLYVVLNLFVFLVGVLVFYLTRDKRHQATSMVSLMPLVANVMNFEPHCWMMWCLFTASMYAVGIFIINQTDEFERGDAEYGLMFLSGTLAFLAIAFLPLGVAVHFIYVQLFSWMVLLTQLTLILRDWHGTNCHCRTVAIRKRRDNLYRSFPLLSSENWIKIFNKD